MSRRPKARAATPEPPGPARTYLADTTVLKPTDPSKADLSDDWTVFDLEDVVVLDRDGRRIENGLLVELRGPLVLRGCLKIDRASKEHVARLQPDYKRIDQTYIEIRNCQKYSIGQDETRPLIYLSGPCGWFEIEPSVEYAPMYVHMGQCVDMYWSLARTYGMHMEPQELREWKRQNKALPSVDEALFQYAVQVGDGSTKEDVLERCRQFAPFLALHMASNLDGKKSWLRTEIYRVLSVMAESQKGQEPYRPSPPPNDYTRPPPKQAPPLSPQQVMRRTAAKKLPTRTKPEPDSPPRQSLHEMAHSDDVYKQGLASLAAALSEYWVVDPARPRSLNGTAPSVGLYLYLFYSIKVYKGTSNLVAYYARDLLPRLDEQDANGGALEAPMPWRNTEFYTWCMEMAMTEWKQSVFDSSQSPFIFRRRGTASHRRSSVGVSTPTTTTNPGKGKLPRSTGGLRLSTTASKKRSAVGLDESGSDDGQRFPKQSKTSHYFSDDDHDDDDHADVHNDTSDANKGSVRVVVEVDRMPSITARGPLGTWKCEHRNCTVFIRAFDNQEALIQQHLETHEGSPVASGAGVVDLGTDDVPDEGDDAPMNANLIQLAVAEGKQSLLPIGNLLDKIKRLGHRQEQAQTVFVDGEPVPVPPPIKGRLLY